VTTRAYDLAVPTTITTGELAEALGVSKSAILKWVRAGLITPEMTTPGGHHRWNEAAVRAQLRALRERDE
jgi:excisionase family DNA binding protein